MARGDVAPGLEVAPTSWIDRGALSGGRERHGCELCLKRQRVAPCLSSLLVNVSVDWRRAVPLPGACRSFPGGSRSHPASPLQGKQWGCLCPVLQVGALPSPQEDAQGSGLPLSAEVSRFTAVVVGRCHADSGDQPCSASPAGGCPNS